MADAPQLDPKVAADLASLALSLSHNPKTRKAFGKLVKEAAPDTPHAQAFVDVDLEDKFEKFRQEQADEKLKGEQERIVRRMNAARQKLLDGDAEGRKYSEDDVKAIEALMQKKGITDYDDGRILYAATLPPVTKPEAELPKYGATWEMPEGSEAYFKNADGAARNMAHQVITEFMRKRA